MWIRNATIFMAAALSFGRWRHFEKMTPEEQASDLFTRVETVPLLHRDRSASITHERAVIPRLFSKQAEQPKVSGTGTIAASLRHYQPPF